MKKIILLICAQFMFSAYGQTVIFGNFKIEEQEIIYQHVFSEDSITLSQLETYYQTLPYVSKLSSRTSGIQFEVTDLTVDYKKFGFSQVGTPPIMQTGKYSGTVNISVRDGKYRVTLQSILLTGDIGYKKIAEKDKLTTYACRDSGTILSPDWCRPNMLGVLDQAFTDKLKYKKSKDDW